MLHASLGAARAHLGEVGGVHDLSGADRRHLDACDVGTAAAFGVVTGREELLGEHAVTVASPRAKTSAIARPIPDPAPVTIATFSANFVISSLLTHRFLGFILVYGAVSNYNLSIIFKLFNRIAHP